MDVHAQGNCVTISPDDITLTRPTGIVENLMYEVLPYQELISFTDAGFFCSIIEAAKLYFWVRTGNYVNLDDFKGFIWMVAMKNEHRNAIIQILEGPTSNMNSFKINNFWNFWNFFLKKI
jgi:hypothetical protein